MWLSTWYMWESDNLVGWFVSIDYHYKLFIFQLLDAISQSTILAASRLQMSSEMAQKWGFISQAHSFYPFAILVDLDNHLD
jgi:hypothetical protein